MSKNQGFRNWIVWLLFPLMGWYGCTASKVFLTGSSLPREDSATEESRNVIQGFKGNTVGAKAIAATISGGGLLGAPNRVNANMGFVGGGVANQAGELGTVCGGSTNAASGFRAFVGGGGQNTADRESATIAGGFGNTARGSHATVGGGTINTAMEVNATVSGGSGNEARERHSTVGGGSVNIAGGFGGTVAGGFYNQAMATYSTISGGISNTSSGIGATVGGGAGNLVNGEEGTVSGGMSNRVSDSYGTTGGGRGNIAGNSNEDPTDAIYATVSGGTEDLTPLFPGVLPTSPVVLIVSRLDIEPSFTQTIRALSCMLTQ
jgi:hypothetical protein